jgi:hypothetical protein
VLKTLANAHSKVDICVILKIEIEIEIEIEFEIEISIVWQNVDVELISTCERYSSKS